MANSKISALTSATTPLAGTETLPIVQSGVTKKVAVADLTAGRSVSTGNLTTTGTMAFTVNTADASGLTGTNSNNSAYFTLMVGGSSGFGVSNWANSTILESVPASTGGLVLGSYTGKTYFQIGRFSYMDLSSSALTFTGINLIQGTAAKGINFTANTAAAGMTSQLLNWYEEGTWTLGLTTAGGNFTSISVNAQTCKYTRVGRTVVVSGAFYTSGTVSGGSGQVYITGLPYSGSDSGIGSVWVNPDTANYNSPSALPTGGIVSGTQFRLFKNGTTNNPAFNSTDLATSGNANNIYFTVSYQV